jgi:cytochrome c
MDFLNPLINPPSAHYLQLLRYLLVLASLMHFTYVGMVICASLLSLIFNSRDNDIPNPTFARMADDLMRMVLPSRVVALVLGVLPLIALFMVYGVWLYKSTVWDLWLMIVGAALVALSFGPLSGYRYTLYREGRNTTVNRGLGGLGLVMLVVGTYTVVGCMVRFQDPERWHLHHHVIRQLTSFNIIWRFALLLVTSMATTGCAMLFFFFTWAGRKPITDEGYAKFVKNFGAGIAIVSLFLIPLMLFFYVVTTPYVALSGAVFGLACLVTVVLFVIFVLLYTNLVGNRVRWGTAPFILFLVVFGLLSFGDQLTLVNATREHTAMLVSEWQEREAQRELEQEATREVKVDPARGKEVFETICMTCHRLDSRLVGPPLNTVLPKYKTVDALVKFVSNPVKVNPDYPPMPNPGLSLSDAKSVATYLLGEVAKQSGEESAPQGNE